jgi:hypothetical protein
LELAEWMGRMGGFTADLHHEFAWQKPVSEKPTYQDLAFL